MACWIWTKPDSVAPGRIGFLKAGLRYADHLTTVSATYAREIRLPDAGMGLDGLLRHRAGVLTGICNGIDDRVWDPATDRHIAAGYSAKRLAAARGHLGGGLV